MMSLVVMKNRNKNIIESVIKMYEITSTCSIL